MAYDPHKHAQYGVHITWGHGGRKWKVHRSNSKQVSLTSNCSWNSIYSMQTFNSTQYSAVQFNLKIVKRKDTGGMIIGIVNNLEYKNTLFAKNQIPNKYYALNGCDGKKASHMTDHKWKRWVTPGGDESSSFNTGDIVSLLIDFVNFEIWFIKNTNNFGCPLFKNAKGMKDRNFRLAISAMWKGDSIELLSAKAIAPITARSGINAPLTNARYLL